MLVWAGVWRRGVVLAILVCRAYIIPHASWNQSCLWSNKAYTFMATNILRITVMGPLCLLRWNIYIYIPFRGKVTKFYQIKIQKSCQNKRAAKIIYINYLPSFIFSSEACGVKYTNSTLSFKFLQVFSSETWKQDSILLWICTQTQVLIFTYHAWVGRTWICVSACPIRTRGLSRNRKDSSNQVDELCLPQL